MKSKLDLAHDWAMKALDEWYVTNTDDLVDAAWIYADAMYAENEKREKIEAEEKRKQMRELLNSDNTFIEKEGQHFDDVEKERVRHDFTPAIMEGLRKAELNEWQPDWSQAPDWATAWSHDRLGSHWWDSAPKKGFDMWIPSNSNSYKYDESPDFNYQGHWRDSLRKRPK